MVPDFRVLFVFSDGKSESPFNDSVVESLVGSIFSPDRATAVVRDEECSVLVDNPLVVFALFPGISAESP